MSGKTTLEVRRSVLMHLFHGNGGGVAGWEAVAAWTLEQEDTARKLPPLEQEVARG